MRAVLLVPRRADNGPRDELWAWIRGWWEREQSDLPIFEGHHDSGPFNRSAAVNRAAELAGDWDVAVIIDADVIADPNRVKQAIEIAAYSGKIVYPHDVRKDLTSSGSRRAMAGYTGAWDRFVAKRYPLMVSAIVCIGRGLWDTIGGFDESFEGWGYEDTAFAAAAETFGGSIRLPGDVWHLWHPTAREGKPGTPAWSINAAKGQRYRAAIGNPDAIRALQAEPRAMPSPERGGTGIPRILHRVVPEHTPELAERWWARFAELHPDWTLLTHRDPLGPSEWPLTARHWHRAANGAQLAGLVRLEALLRWGGVYVDEDVEPIRALDPFLPLEAFAAWEDERCVPDAVIGARSGHPAIRAALELAIARVATGGSSERATWASGPGVLTELLPGRSDVLLLPPGSFYAVRWGDPERDARMDAFEPARHPWAFALHHYWGSWLDEKRRRVPA